MEGVTRPPWDSNVREVLLQMVGNDSISSSKVLVLVPVFTALCLPSRVTFYPFHFFLLASSWFGVSHYGLPLQQPNSPRVLEP